MSAHNAKHILVITSGNLASNPRCLKELRVLAAKKYKLTVLKFDFNNWTSEPEQLLENEFDQIIWIKISATRNPFLPWMFSTIAKKTSGALLKMFNNSGKLLSFAINKRSYLIYKALDKLTSDFDLVIAHNPAAFWPAYSYAKKHRIPFGIDIEDYHPGETNDVYESTKMLQLMQKVLPFANYVTAASPLILDYSLKNTQGIEAKTVVINNVFAKSDQQQFNVLPVYKNDAIRLFWFSQHIGLNRGVQDAILAISLINTFPVQLTLLGNCADNVRAELSSLLTNSTHQLIFKPACHEKELLQIASENHIGLALEPGFNLNNKIALSNKIFTYLLAGNIIIASDTDAQKLFMEQYPQAGFLYPVGNAQKLSEIISALYGDIEKLQAIRKSNYLLAQHELNWETEQKIFLTLVENALS